MTIRLALLGLSHEANTFCHERVDLAVFAADGILLGDQILAQHQQAQTTVAGFLSIGAEPDVEVTPLIFTTTTPAGMITRGTVDEFAGRAEQLLTAQGPWDGVLLALHGAAVAEDHADADGYLIERIRRLIGPTVPIGVALDLHANISARMAENSDVLATYRTNPHIDAKERAAEVAHLILRTTRGEIVARQAWLPVPAAINILRQNTAASPMAELMSELAAMLDRPEVLTASIAQGYPYADVPEMGMSVVVVTSDDSAARRARELAERVWARREDFTCSAEPVDLALRTAAEQAGPVLLLDVGDNIGGGAAGDSVVILAAARRLNIPRLLCIIDDPAAAARCHHAGIGADLTLSLGGHSDPTVGPPLTLQARVIALNDGQYAEDEPTHGGARYFNCGDTAAIGTGDGQVVVLTSTRVMPTSLTQLRMLGLDPGEFSVIVAKGVQSPLAAYLPVVGRTIQVDTPGVTAADLGTLNYQHRRRPLYPFEDVVDPFPEAPIDGKRAGVAPVLRWDETTRTRLAAVLPTALVVMPLGATEQHGPHLPTGVDAFVAHELVQRAADAADARCPIVVTPTVRIGASDHHFPFGGTLSLQAETLTAVLVDLLRSIATSGGRRIVMVNAHGGNTGPCTTAAAIAANRFDVAVAYADYWTLLPPPTSADIPMPGHAGAFETSLMLALRPELVGSHPGRAAPTSDTPATTPAGGFTVASARGWAEMDGYTDDPQVGDASAGSDWFDELAAALTARLEILAATL